MGSFSTWHWMVMLIVAGVIACLWVIPTAKILTKAGYSGWWSLLLLVPLINLVACWVFAFSQWPNLRRAAPPTPDVLFAPRRAA